MCLTCVPSSWARVALLKSSSSLRPSQCSFHKAKHRLNLYHSPYLEYFGICSSYSNFANILKFSHLVNMMFLVNLEILGSLVILAIMVNLTFPLNPVILVYIMILMNLVIFLKLMTLVVLVQSVTNIFEYLNIRIFLIQIFIQIFVCIIFWIGIYSDIRLCQLFGYKYIRIFVCSKISNEYIQIFVQFQFSDSDDVFV